MNKTEGKNLRVVLYEGPGSAPLPAEDRYRAISALLQNGFEVSRPAAGGSVAPADGAPMLVGRLRGVDLRMPGPAIASPSLFVDC